MKKLNNKEKIEKIKKIIDKANRQFKFIEAIHTKKRVYFPRETKRQYCDRMEEGHLIYAQAIQRIMELLKIKLPIKK